MKSDEKNVMTSRQPLPLKTDLTLEAATPSSMARSSCVSGTACCP
jgi:hypothetical protein